MAKISSPIHNPANEACERCEIRAFEFIVRSTDKKYKAVCCADCLDDTAKIIDNSANFNAAKRG